MAAYPTVNSVLQGGNVNQAVANGFLISGAQPSQENCGSIKNMQLHETFVAGPNDYGVTNVSDRVIMKYPAVGGQNVTNVNYFNQNKILSTSNVNTSDVIVQGNGQTGFIASSSHLNQTTGNVNDNKATMIKEGNRSIHEEDGSDNVNNHVQKGPCGSVPMMGTVPALTLIKLRNDGKEKIGNLKIHMSESFLPGTIVSYKGILDLNFMRNLFEITNVDISFVNDIPFKSGICEALKQIIHNNLLQDWLMLKCEQKQIQIFKLNDQIQIYSVKSFMGVLSKIAQESSLPLPFITKDSNDNTVYYYINFHRGGYDRVKKLNYLIFYDAENGRKKVPCRYPGMRLDCNFETSVAGFTIHVHESAMSVYKNSVSYIRQLIIYGHIVWGFLQAWILNVREHHNGCFSAGDISKNLILSQTSEINALTGNDDGMMYFIGYSNFYLKFDPILLKEIKATFSIENFETTFACNISIAQYYRQFILINDLHYSDALKNIILFSKKNEKSGSRTTKNTYLPQKTKTNFKGDCFQPKSSSQEPQSFQQKVVSHLFANTESGPSNEEGASGGVALQVESDPPISRPGLEGGSSVHTRNIGNTGKEPQQPQKTADSERPRIKTRTVNEINSLLETPDGVGFQSVGFHNEKISDPIAKERKEISVSTLAVMVELVLKRCYATNSLVLTTQDESNDPNVIHKKFDEAVNKAMGCLTLESFIEKIYLELLFSFTNKTSQIILSSLIGKAIGVKYPMLKGKFLSCFGSIRKESGGSNKTQAGNPAASTASDAQGKMKQNFFSVSGGVAPTTSNFIIINPSIGRNAALVQTKKSVPSNLAAVAPIISGQSSIQQNFAPIISGQSSIQQNFVPIIFGQSSVQQNSARIISGQSSIQPNSAPIISGQSSIQPNSAPIISGQSSMQRNSYGAEMEKNKTRGEPLMAQKNVPARANASKRQCPLEPYESRNKSDHGQDRLNRSSSSTQTDNSNRKKFPVFRESHKKICIFDFNVNSAGEKFIPKDPPQVSVSQDIFRRSEEPKVATVNPSVVQNPSSDSEQNISVDPQCQDKQTIMKTNELINATVLLVSPLCQLKTSAYVEKATDNKSPTPDFCRDNRDSLKISSHSDDTVEDLPPVTEEDIFHRYKLKPCSVVLNADDVSNYFKMREKENEVNEVMSEINEADETDEMHEADFSSDASNDINFRFYQKNCGKRNSLCDVPDFYDSVSQKGMKRKKGVSELEYMEARTRVIQRLRKRSAMYTGWTENEKMTSDELDNFFVKRNSFVGRSPYVEDSTDENAGDGEGRSETAEESGGVTRNEYSKKELRVALVRLEDTPEYEKYKDSVESVIKKSKMIRMGDKAETYYEHILDKKKHYFQLIDGKLYLKEQYCVQDGVIVPAGVRPENSNPVMNFKEEPESPEIDGNFSTEFIKQENTVD